jgi:hypothetical protein
MATQNPETNRFLKWETELDDFKGLISDVSGDICGMKYAYCLLILPAGAKVKLCVEPEFRHDGTQNFDGQLPRYYTEPKYAKSFATRLLGDGLIWQEIKN